MSAQQRKAAEFILINYKMAAFLTSTDLAQRADVSPATLNRLARMLGYGGYSPFQTALQELIQTELTAIDRVNEPSGFEDSLEKVFHDEAEALMLSISKLPRHAYQSALELLKSKNRLIIVGHQACEPVAHYAAYCIGKVRQDVEIFDFGTIDSVGKMNSLTENDVAIIFCLPRYPIRTIQALEELHNRKVPIILVTHSDLCEYNHFAEVVLPIYVRYYKFSDGLSPLISFINALAIDVYNECESVSKENLEVFERLAQHQFVQKV